MTSRTADPDTLLADRCVNILKHDGGSMDCVRMARLLREDSSACYRAMAKHPGLVMTKGTALTLFSVAK